MDKILKSLALLALSAFLPSLGTLEAFAAPKSDDTITLRVCNWEEYIDQGGWNADEVIDLPSGDILGENSLVKDFEDWYQETYGQKVKVEYSTFGTNEDLPNFYQAPVSSCTFSGKSWKSLRQ